METFNSNPSVTITDEIKNYVIQTSKWMKFLSILGFVGLGLMAIGGLSMFALGASFGEYMHTPFNPMLFGFFYLVFAVLYFFPVLYLFKAAVGLKEGVNGSQDSLTSGFMNLKMHYRYVGILTIVIISLYILLIIGAVIFVAFNLPRY